LIKYFNILGRFAVVGAASLVASVTHTLAIAVVAFELTGSIILLFPVLVGVVTSYALSKKFSVSIYHVLVEIKNLPFLPRLLDPS
jgi:H+/Cl- antiporter ClcA